MKKIRLIRSLRRKYYCELLSGYDNNYEHNSSGFREKRKKFIVNSLMEYFHDEKN